MYLTPDYYVAQNGLLLTQRSGMLMLNIPRKDGVFIFAPVSFSILSTSAFAHSNF